MRYYCRWRRVALAVGLLRLTAGAAGAAPPPIEDWLRRAEDAEQQVVTGRVWYTLTRESFPQTDEEIRARYGDEPDLDSRLAMVAEERERPQHVQRCELRFDNAGRRARLETFSGARFEKRTVTVWTRERMEQYIEPAEGAARNQAEPPRWPPVDNWRLLCLRWWEDYGDYGRAPDVGLAWQSYADDEAVVAVEARHYVIQVTLDPVVPERPLLVDLRPPSEPPVIRSELRVEYAVSEDGAAHPCRITDRMYDLVDEGQPLRAQTTLEVTAYELNVDLADADFEIGPPSGTFMSDSRFDPPLNYRQPDQPLTDDQLFDLARDPEAQARLNTDQPPPRPRRRWPTALLLGATLVAAGAVILWRLAARDRVRTE